MVAQDQQLWNLFLQQKNPYKTYDILVYELLNNNNIISGQYWHGIHQPNFLSKWQVLPIIILVTLLTPLEQIMWYFIPFTSHFWHGWQRPAVLIPLYIFLSKFTRNFTFMTLINCPFLLLKRGNWCHKCTFRGKMWCGLSSATKSLKYNFIEHNIQIQLYE